MQFDKWIGFKQNVYSERSLTTFIIFVIDAEQCQLYIPYVALLTHWLVFAVAFVLTFVLGWWQETVGNVKNHLLVKPLATYLSRFLPKVILLLAHISITMLLQFTFHWEHFRLPIVDFWMLSLPKQVPLLAHIWIDVPQWFTCHWEHLELSWNCSEEAYQACRTLFSVWNQIVVLQFLSMCASMPRVQAHCEMCVKVGCLSELSLLQDYSCAWKENAMECSVLCGSTSLKLYLLVLHWSLRTAFTITLFVIRCFLIIELHNHLSGPEYLSMNTVECINVVVHSKLWISWHRICSTSAHITCFVLCNVNWSSASDFMTVNC